MTTPWHCDSCSYLNPDAASCCLECGTPSSSGDASPSGEATRTHCLRIEAALIDPDLTILPQDFALEENHLHSGVRSEWVVMDTRQGLRCLISMNHFYANSVNAEMVKEVLSAARRLDAQGAIVVIQKSICRDAVPNENEILIDDAAGLALLAAPIELHTLSAEFCANIRGTVLRVSDSAPNGPSHVWKIRHLATRAVVKAAVPRHRSEPSTQGSVESSPRSSSISVVPASVEMEQPPVRKMIPLMRRESIDKPGGSASTCGLSGASSCSQRSGMSGSSELSAERRARAARRRALLAELQELERQDQEEEERGTMLGSHHRTFSRASGSASTLGEVDADTIRAVQPTQRERRPPQAPLTAVGVAIGAERTEVRDEVGVMPRPAAPAVTAAPVVVPAATSVLPSTAVSPLPEYNRHHLHGVGEARSGGGGGAVRAVPAASGMALPQAVASSVSAAPREREVVLVPSVRLPANAPRVGRPPPSEIPPPQAASQRETHPSTAQPPPPLRAFDREAPQRRGSYVVSHGGGVAELPYGSVRPGRSEVGLTTPPRGVGVPVAAAPVVERRVSPRGAGAAGGAGGDSALQYLSGARDRGRGGGAGVTVSRVPYTAPTLPSPGVRGAGVGGGGSVVASAYPAFASPRAPSETRDDFSPECRSPRDRATDMF